MGAQRQIGGYTVLDELGRGGMGVVYRARGPAGRQVALKVCTPGVANVEEAARFAREGRLLAEVEHPGWVRLIDAGDYRGTPYLVMELVEGGSLAERLAQRGKLAPDLALELIVRVADAVAELHRRGVVHRDLKPSNVLLDASGAPKVCDLGIARGDELSRLTETGVILGTPAYLAPELINGEPVGPAADVYALGVILYQLLCGEPPFSGSQLQVLHAHVSDAAPDLRARCPQAAPALRALVARCLEKRPADRFASAHELTAALRGLAGGRARAATRAARPPSLTLAFGALSLALIGVAAVGLMLYTRSEHEPPPPVSQADDPLAQALSQARAALAEHDWVAARRAFTRACELAPDNAEAWTGRAEVETLEGRRRTALSSAQRALDADPEHRAAHLSLILNSCDVGEVALAHASLEAGLERFGEAPELLVLATRLLYREGHTGAAVAAMRRLVVEHPENASVQHWLGWLLSNGSTPADGLEPLERAVELEPANPTYRVHHLSLLASVERVSVAEVLARFRELQQGAPQSVEYAAAVASYFTRLEGNTDAALAAWKQALELDPLAVNPRRIRGEYLAATRTHVRLAEADLRFAIEHQPDADSLHKKLIELLQVQRRPQAAWEAAVAFTRLQPHEGRAWKLRTVTAERLGKLDDFDTCETGWWRAAPTEEAALNHATLYLRYNRREGVLRCLRRAADTLSSERTPARVTLELIPVCLAAQEGEREAIEELAALGPPGTILPTFVFTSRLRGLLANGSISEARAFARSIVEPRALSPALRELQHSIPLRLACAEALARGQDPGVAHECVAFVLARRPAEPQALHLLAELYGGHGGSHEAVGFTQLALRLAAEQGIELPEPHPRLRARMNASPELLEQHFALSMERLIEQAHMHLEARALASAHLALRVALAREPGSRDAWMLLGEVEQLRRFRAHAQLAFRQAWQLPEPSPEVLARLGVAELLLRRTERAEELVGQALAREPQGRWPLIADLKLALHRQGTDAADLIRRADALAAAFPDDTDVVEAVANVYRKFDPLQGLAYLEAHVQRRPGSPRWYELAQQRAATGDLDGAERALDRVPGPKDLNMHQLVLRAELAVVRKNTLLAERCVGLAIQQNPLDPAFWALLARSLQTLGLEQNALRFLQRTYSLQSRKQRAKFYTALVDFEFSPATRREAAAWAAQLARFDPNAGDARLLQATLALAAKAHDDAKRFAREALACEGLIDAERKVAERILAYDPPR